MKQKLIFLVGPTAAGKSAAAVALAKKIKAEIISCDSMQIYKGMEIITSKPAAVLIKQVNHHLISIISPVKEYNVSQYRKAALKKAKEIIKRRKIPLFVGGTGFYMSILLDGIFDLKAGDESIRKRLYAEAKLHDLYQRLKAVDPQAALKIHPHDTRRIVRALEVYAATGKPISELQKQRKGLSHDYDVKIFCLNMPRPKLYRRIDSRVTQMFQRGLIGEVKKLLKMKLSRTASGAIGIKELKGYFDGQYDLDGTKQRMQKNTRNYAKRQLTWFRKDKRIEWINLSGKETAQQVAGRLWKKPY